MNGSNRDKNKNRSIVIRSGKYEQYTCNSRQQPPNSISSKPLQESCIWTSGTTDAIAFKM
jgi:hypothetical protein